MLHGAHCGKYKKHMNKEVNSDPRTNPFLDKQKRVAIARDLVRSNMDEDVGQGLEWVKTGPWIGVGVSCY